MIEHFSSFTEIYRAVKDNALTTDFLGRKWVAESIRLQDLIDKVNSLFHVSGCPPEEREDLKKLSKKIVQWKSSFTHPFQLLSHKQPLHQHLFSQDYYSESPWRNEATFIYDPLINFPKSRLFVTEDNFCFLIDDLIDMVKNKKKVINPYTAVPFSESDCRRLFEIPECQDIEQEIYASQISQATIDQLKTYVEVNLNKYAIDDDYFITVTRQYTKQLDDYLFSLDEKEKQALNAYYIEKWDNFHSDWTVTIAGIGGMTFGELYAMRNDLTPSTFTGSLVKLITQLDLSITFNVNRKDAAALITSIRKS